MNPIYSKDGFLFFSQIAGPDKVLKEDRLIVESSRLDETIDYSIKNKITSIHIASQYYKDGTVSFLEQLKFIKGLYVLVDKLDLSSVNKLTDLEVLRINLSTKVIDFSNFNKLKVASFNYHKNVVNAESCSAMEWLWINGLSEANLERFSGLSALEYLNLYKAGIKNLHGIEGLHQLTNVRLDTVPNLESLEGLSKQLAKLTVLDIWNAPLLSDYISLGNLKHLEQLELRKTGEMNSASMLLSLKNLNKVTLGLKVLDGNMKQLKNIPEVGYIDYPHYDVKLKNLKK